ncbi:MAG: sugar phosphate isomerase/epimerase [Marinilabiliaceae bacterium]|nr:sugar phosphate isomerase/epimerase [Marinilabiliaceae bacterium]
MSTNRRIFLKQTGLLLAGGIVGNRLLSSCAVSPISKKHIGLQLYSLRDDVKELGIKRVLEIVSKMGYQHLETAGYSDGKIYGLEPKEFKTIVEDLGMRATSAHLSRNISGNEDEDFAWWNKAIEAHNEAGMKYMVMPISPLSGDGATIENVKRYGEYFNTIGMNAAAASINFGYHNHAFEFNYVINDIPIFDLLMENTSPQHVSFQLDVFWCIEGGYDPVDYLKKYPKRIQMLHIKDDKAIGASGKIDFKPIFDTFYSNGMKDWYVEVEQYDGTPQEDVKNSYDFLNNAGFVK